MSNKGKDIKNHRSKVVLGTIVILLASAMAVSAWVFTDPPNGNFTSGGYFQGNISLDTKNVTGNMLKVMGEFGAVIGSYVDSYSCDGSYCIYLPWYDSGKIYTKNMSDGNIIYKGTNLTKAFEYARDNLTSGRLQKEVIVFNGRFTADASSTLTLTSADTRTVLWGYGALIDNPANHNMDMFYINGANEVEMHGFILNGSDTQNTQGDAIKLNGAQDFHLFQTKIRYFRGSGINQTSSVSPSYGAKIEWSYITNNSVSGIRGVGLADAVYSNNAISNNGWAGNTTIGFGYGLYMDGASTAMNNQLWGNSQGIGVKSGANYTWIENNEIDTSDSYSIRFEGGSFYHKVLGNRIWLGNRRQFASIDGISMYNTNSSIIERNTIDCGNCSYAIAERSTAENNNTIINNIPINWSTGVVLNRGNSSFHDNLGATPYNHGSRTQAPLVAYGVLDTYQNSTSGEAFCSYKSSTWQNATGDTTVC